MVTPSMDIVDLIERGGLFWLKFKRAVVPAAHHAAPDAKFVLSDAASFAAQSKYRPATVVDDDDPCVCTSVLEPSPLLPAPRLVAKGFSQSSAHGDFDETYSPVMAYPSLRALLALAAANGYMITGF